MNNELNNNYEYFFLKLYLKKKYKLTKLKKILSFNLKVKCATSLNLCFRM